MNKTKAFKYTDTVADICFYTGLTLAALGIPGLVFILWMMSLMERADPNYGYLFLSWLVSMLVFVVGVVLKKRACAERQ